MTRISIISDDPGYDARHERRVKAVTLDGKAMVGVVTADEEQGFVLALTQDPATGEWLRDPVSGNFTLSRMTGVVSIELLPPGEREWDVTRRADGVRVNVGVEPGTGDLLVQVYSVVRPGAIKQGRLQRARMPHGEAALCQAAGVLGGAVAEALCEDFRDTVDPSAVAAEAVRQCARMLSERG